MPKTQLRGVRALLGLVVAATVIATAVPPTTAAAEGSSSSAATVRVAKVRIGTSVQGRPIVAVHRWRPGATRKILVIGSIHGDERAGLRVVDGLRRRALPEDVNLWLIRTVNPDGTAADRRTNARGVDLNRNFPHHWVRAGAGTSIYSGPRAASEPETRALIAFVEKRQPRTTIALHQPLYGVDSYRAKSMRLVRELSRWTGLPLKSFSCSGGCHGTFTEWHNVHTSGRAVTVEFGHRPSAWRIRKVASAVLRIG